jgi:hypothetical protein
MSDEPDNPSPDSTAEIERLEAQRDELLRLQVAMTAKLKARPNDYGTRVWWGFVIIGLLVGWIRASSFWSILVYGWVFWIVGMFFCIFALDSAEVQSKIAISLHKLGEVPISKWLYQRALNRGR